MFAVVAPPPLPWRARNPQPYGGRLQNGNFSHTFIADVDAITAIQIPNYPLSVLKSNLGVIAADVFIRNANLTFIDAADSEWLVENEIPSLAVSLLLRSASVAADGAGARSFESVIGTRPCVGGNARADSKPFEEFGFFV